MAEYPVVVTADAAYTAGTRVPLTQTTGGRLRVEATVPAGGIVAESEAIATAAAPTYVEGTLNPLSQDLAGNLRVKDAAALTALGLLATQATQAAVLAALVGPRPFQAKTTQAYANTTYANLQSFGTVLAVDLLGLAGVPVSTLLSAITVRIKASSTQWTTASTPEIYFCDANPAASTFTDGSAIVVVDADVPKVILATAGGANTGQVGAINIFTVAGPRIKTDEAGKIYLGFGATGASVFAAPGTIPIEISGTY